MADEQVEAQIDETERLKIHETMIAKSLKLLLTQQQADTVI